MKTIACLTVLLVFLVPGRALSQQPVHFADANLEAAVEAALGISDPRPTDLQNLAYLEIDDSGIADLTGIEYATNMTGLELDNNQIRDISALSRLTELRFLFLTGSQIDAISALSGLRNLERLRLHGNRINDISALSGLTKLSFLDLHDNEISDISALSELTTLVILNLQSNPLNADAYNIYIPQILENNPGIELYYDQSYIAWNPGPPNGAVVSEPNLVLYWEPGAAASLHDFYFGTDADAVANADLQETGGIYRGRQVVTNYTPGELEAGTTYYWRVDEVNDANPDSPWKGDVWSFTTAPYIPPDPRLVGWWKFDEGQGTIAFDSSGHGNHGTLAGDPQWVAGITGGALEFDGDGDYVKTDETTNRLDFAPNSFSLSAWINAREVTDGWRTILEYERDGRDHNRFGLWLNSEGRFHFRVGWDTENSNQILIPDEWYLLTATYDSIDKRMALYINGWFDNSRIHSGGFNSPSVSKVTIGVRGWEDEEYFNGRIDDVRIYDHPLSENDIVNLSRPTEVIYVDDAAAGANDGSSWRDAYNHLQDALNSATKPAEIRVAQGIYRPDEGAGIMLGDREATFQLINGVTIRGGYAGFGEPDPDARDVGVYETILSGDLNGDDVRVSDPCGLLNEPTRAENSYHVITAVGTDETAVLDGFITTGGNADGSDPRDNGGGGVYCYSSSPTISNCIITYNKAWRGGGVFCHNSSPTIVNCTISNNEPDGIGLDPASDAWILGTVHVVSDALTGEGALHLESDSILSLDGSHVSCNVVGLGTIQVPVGKELIVENNAIVDLGDPNDPDVNGTIRCDGWLRVTDNAQLLNAEINVARASFEGNAVISNNVITVQAKGLYTRIVAKDSATIVDNDIHANGDRYMDLVALTFAGVIQDNRVFITITEGRDDTRAGLFELRGRDLHCLEPPCGPGAFSLPTVPASDQVTWTIERMELQSGTVARLTNRFDFQPPYGSGGAGEVLYVKQLILGPYAVLDTTFNRLYYESLQMHPTAEIVNLPLLAFALNDLDFDDGPEFLSRVIHNNLIDPDQPAMDRIHVERVVGLEPDPAGMMRMRNLPDLDPTSPNYRRMISARAKGLFGKASEDEIVIRFNYLFESAEPGTELVVYLSDVPELLARNDPQWAEHYLEVARLAAPPPGRPGSAGSGRFGVFQQRVPTEHLSFIEATWIELELVEPQSIVGVLSGSYRAAQSNGGGAKILINDMNPAIWCYGICLDLNSDNFVNEVDFLMVIGELGHAAIGDLDCVDGVLSDDGYVDPHDVVSWDWAMNAADRLLNFCGVPLVSGSVSMSGIVAMGSAAQLPLGSLPSNFSDLLITGKRDTDGAATKLQDRLYVFDSNGLCTGWSAPASDRCNIAVVQDLEGKLYQLNSETGVSRLDDPNVVIIPSGEIELTDINEPRYDKTATVYVGIQGEDPDAFGRPILDAAFDANYVYVVPVVVDPDGNDPYVAAAKLELLDGEEPPYQVLKLYDDPNTFNPNDSDNPNLGGLCDVELDDQGNLYVLNVHSRNESDILWRYEPNGAIERLDLGVKDSNNYVLGPTAMHVSNTADMLYLASSQYNPNDVNSTVIYGFSTDGPLTLEQSVTITGMHHVSSITEDPATGSLWVAGFNMEDIPLFPNPDEPPFYEPYLAKIPPDSNDVQLISLSDPDSHDLAMPMSIVWTEAIKCGGADIDGSGDVDFADFAALAKHWLGSGCGPPDWCGGADVDKNKRVDIPDVAIMTRHWLETGCLE